MGQKHTQFGAQFCATPRRPKPSSAAHHQRIAEHDPRATKALRHCGLRQVQAPRGGRDRTFPQNSFQNYQQIQVMASQIHKPGLIDSFLMSIMRMRSVRATNG